MADYSWIGTVVQAVGNVVSNIVKSNKEKKENKNTSMAEQSPDMSQTHILYKGHYYSYDYKGTTMQEENKKAGKFGVKFDLTGYIKNGKDVAGNDLYIQEELLKLIKAGPSKKSGSNIIPDVLNSFGNAVGGLFGGNNSSSGSGSGSASNPLAGLVNNVFKPVNLVLIGGAGYGIWYYLKKVKKPGR